MKKITSLFILCGLTMVSVADAAPSYIKRDNQGGYNVTYNYTDKEKNGWYVAARAELNMLNWKNEYSSNFVGFGGEDKYSLKPVFGGSIAVGKKFNHWWRGELEAGYTGIFSDEDAGIEFKLSAPYLMANAMYDFENGLYLGGGLGIAAPTTTWDWDAFLNGDRTKTSISPMAAIMLGYTHKLDDNFVLDIRYRLGGFAGTKHTRNFEDVLNNQYNFESKIGFVMDNSLSVGIRYEF